MNHDSVLTCYVAKYFAVPTDWVKIARQSSAIVFYIQESSHTPWEGTKFIVGTIQNTNKGLVINTDLKLHNKASVEDVINNLTFNNDLNKILEE